MILLRNIKTEMIFETLVELLLNDPFTILVSCGVVHPLCPSCSSPLDPLGLYVFGLPTKTYE